MKNILKYFIITCAVLGVLFLTGCSDQSDFEKITSNKSNGKLRITINGGDTGRTLYPSVVFVKYELQFVNIAGGGTYSNVLVDKDTKYVTVDDLPNGTWEITAIGYVAINGVNYPAAEGTETVIVSGNKFKSINIDIRAQQGGDPGFFSYSIEFPSTVNYAWLEIYEFQNLNNNFPKAWRNLIESNKDTIVLPSGYYLMKIDLYTPYRDSDKAVSWTEIIHIYSNMETKAGRVYTEEDLTKFITISGNVDVKINGNPYDSYMYIYLFRDENYLEYFSYFYFYGDEYNISFPAFDAPTTLYARLEFGNISRNLGPIELHNKDVVFNILDIDINKITINGTANITIDGAVPDDMNLNIFSDADWRDYLGDIKVSSNGTWSMEIDDIYLGSDLYFILMYYFTDFDDYLVADLGSKKIDQNNLVILDQNINTITLSGTINLNVKLNGQPYNGDLDLFAYISIDQPGDIVFGLYLDFNNNTWSVKMAPFKTTRTFYIYLCVALGGKTLFSWGDDWDSIDEYNYAAEVIISGGNVSNINLGTLTCEFEGILLSGNVDIIADGIFLIQKYVYADWGNYRNNRIKQDGSWNILLDAFDIPTTVYFELRADDTDWNYYGKKTGITREVFNSNISGIDLGTQIISLDDWWW